MISSPIQNGKKPDCGPSAAQPIPTCRLPAMVMAPSRIMKAATPISTWRCFGPANSGSSGGEDIKNLCRTGSRRRVSCSRRSVAVQESRFLHQVAMALFFVVDPRGVLGAGHRRLVEGAFTHELGP